MFTAELQTRVPQNSLAGQEGAVKCRPFGALFNELHPLSSSRQSVPKAARMGRTSPLVFSFKPRLQTYPIYNYI
jgi:hypothetical protein